MKIKAALLLLVGVSEAFMSSQTRQRSSCLSMASDQSLIVVSPPGGVGEVAAVKAACLGASVRWFVVSDKAGSSVTLAPQALEEISDASGSLALAGANLEDLESGGEAFAAVSQWCGQANGIICSYDGCNSNEEFKAAIRLVSNEAAAGVSGNRVAILGADEDFDETDEREEGAVSNLVGSLFGSAPKVPLTLTRCLGGNAAVVRHGQLFGIPESSPDFSPLVGGPRRAPTIADEYTMRNVRVDPFVVSGNVMASSTLKACRHAVGEVAALLATGSLKGLSEAVSISSQAGTDVWTLDQWEEEFDRLKELISSGKASTLFTQEMIVDNTERLADWLATKWAPAVMRTYDIAAIRIGARPVFANRVDEAKVEIVWQELVDFQSVVVGKMLLEVTKDGITATRGAGDASKGYGAISKRPLNGEDVLVRRLSEAASQSIEKGLAKKIPSKKQPKVQVAVAPPASSLASAGNVESTPKAPAVAETGPRQAGARRSTPRERRGTNKSS